MANYKIVGNTDPKEIFGKANLEIMLKGLNITKEICVKIGAEQTPKLFWNNNMPTNWAVNVGAKVVENLKTDIKWKPTEEFIEECRKELICLE